MKKRIISVMAILALMFGPICIPQAPAQILIIDEEEEEDSERTNTEASELELPMVPELGITIDQYAPVGSGTIVIGLLAGAYLVGKKRKSEEN